MLEGRAQRLGQRLEQAPHLLHVAAEERRPQLLLHLRVPGPQLFERGEPAIVHEVGAREVEGADGFLQALVERYDAVKFGIFQRNLSNFRGLVLFCIEADFCNQILIL